MNELFNENPFASPTAADDPPPPNERERLPGRRVFLPLLLAPVVTALVLLFSVWTLVTIGQIWPGSEFPDSYPPLDRYAVVTCLIAGISLAFAAVLAAPLLYWLWRSQRLSSKLLTIITLGLLVANIGAFAGMFYLDPGAKTDNLASYVYLSLMFFSVPLIAPYAFYTGWIYWLERSSSVNQD